MKPHIETAHAIWKTVVKPGDTVIDATCGNGHDTLVLAQLALSEEQGAVYAIDTQLQAIANTKKRLQEQLPSTVMQKIQFIHGCHSTFPDIPYRSVKMIVYNLGYLPGGNKAITTRTDTTLTSLQQAMLYVQDDGRISLTCYPGHPEGKVETEAVSAFLQNLNPVDWNYSQQEWIRGAPHLIILKRSLQQHSG